MGLGFPRALRGAGRPVMCALACCGSHGAYWPAAVCRRWLYGSDACRRCDGSELVQVLAGVGGRGLLGEDRTEAAGAGDQAARFYRVLRWVQDRAARPLLLAIDDMHWADADSL